MSEISDPVLWQLIALLVVFGAASVAAEWWKGPR